MQRTISANQLFTGKKWLYNVGIQIQNGYITHINEQLYNASNAINLVTPTLIDLQIYGAYGKLLSADPSADTIAKIYQYCLKSGTAYFQPTVATNSYEIIYQCIDAVHAYQQQGGKGSIGLHIEGPWIHPVKRGAHALNYIHSPNLSEVEALVQYGKGCISMITLAPEVCSAEIITYLQQQNIVVSAGHSNASYEQAITFFNKGIGVATHLFNAMSGLHHREPGMVGAICNHPTVMCSIVVDGYHVDFAAIRIAKKLIGHRLFCITDAVTETSVGDYQHQLNGDKFESNGILSGSALTQLTSVRNLVNYVGITLDEAIQMCSTYPALAIGQPALVPEIAVGVPALFICLNSRLDLVEVIV